MNVIIMGEAVAYFPNYSATSKLWKVQLRDAFQIAKLGDTECFIKRFASRPRAWDFMVVSKGKKQTGLPTIYDAVATQEDGSVVYYLFLEKIEGDTLHEHMKDKAAGKPSVSLLAKALAAGLRSIHAQGYWHADFCAKNIMVSASGRRFVFIDLDSLEPAATRPTPTPNEPGYIPDQELAIYSLQYIKSHLDPSVNSFTDIPGPALNYLQLVFLLDKLVYFASILKPRGVKFRELAAFRELPTVVHRHLGGYTNQLAKRILDRTADSEMLITQPLFFQKELLPKPQSLTPPAPAPVRLDFFRCSRQSVPPGRATQLTWKVEGVTSVHISQLGTRPAEGSYLILHSSDLIGEQVYTLTAGGTVSQTITVDFISLPHPAATSPPTPAGKRSAPVYIASFRASSTFVKKGEQTVISWKVTGPGSVFITNIGTVPAAGAKSFDADTFNGLVEFELTAGSPAVRESLFVQFSPAATPSSPAKPTTAFTPPRSQPAAPRSQPAKPSPTLTATVKAPVAPPSQATVNVPVAPPAQAAQPVVTLPAASLSPSAQATVKAPTAPPAQAPVKPPVAPPTQATIKAPIATVSPQLQVTKKRGVWKAVLWLCVLAGGGWAWAESFSNTTPFEPNQLRGLQQFDQGRYDSSFVNLVKFRNDTSHHFATQYNLAYMYDKGKGTSVDDTLAVELYKQSLRSAVPAVVSKSLYALGLCSLQGEGCFRDTAKAKEYLALAAVGHDNANAIALLESLSKVTARLPSIAAPSPRPSSMRGEAFVPSTISTAVALNPPVGSFTPTATFSSISRIEQLGNCTRVDFTYSNPSETVLFLPSPSDQDATYIEWAGLRFASLLITGIGDRQKPSYYYPGKPSYFSVYFEKIPKGATEIKITDGSGVWAFSGIKMSLSTVNN
ncbi:hypothetical protein LGH70_22825 [Hymenobacter sp. BT635]|uniref:Protein kinase domain-containing protein n=1 Tax=Hymenobacter nitidus TaxID=2880929 RepID=A0ABS8AJ41_9BACT|nr:tetratricopeptide repeat protein [Hymenobacter nitidus]MCB2380445.1 hypothetical protein [Hymenobacter nitidus]